MNKDQFINMQNEKGEQFFKDSVEEQEVAARSGLIRCGKNQKGEEQYFGTAEQILKFAEPWPLGSPMKTDE